MILSHQTLGASVTCACESQSVQSNGDEGHTWKCHLEVTEAIPMESSMEEGQEVQMHWRLMDQS